MNSVPSRLSTWRYDLVAVVPSLLRHLRHKSHRQQLDTFLSWASQPYHRDRNWIHRSLLQIHISCSAMMYRSSNRSFPTLTSSALPYPKNVHTSARRKIIVIQSLLLFQNGIHRCTILHRSCPKLSWWWGYRDRSKAPVYVILCDSGSWDTMPRIHHEFQDMWLPRLQISSSLHLWRHNWISCRGW